MLIAHPVHTATFNSELFSQSVGVIKTFVEETGYPQSLSCPVRSLSSDAVFSPSLGL